MFTIEPLFDMETETAPQREYWYIKHDDGSLECPHCGEISANLTIAEISHCRVFNGWCATRLLCNHGANDIQLKYLAEHGFEICDPHDKDNWA
jgi:hypothetical protein